MKAVLCDIYKTLLEVGPPPAETDARWGKLCRVTLPETPPTLAAFGEAAERLIQKENAAAQATGVLSPEIYWPTLAQKVWPALASLTAAALDDFLFEHAQLQRTVRLMPGAAECLRWLSNQKILLGLVSNSQPYTLRELEGALLEAGLGRTLFLSELSFFSFDHGFSKPNPHVFRILTARLAARAIAPEETLVIGDRADNDILPARAAGFRTWQLTVPATSAESGDWAALHRWLLQTER